MGPGAWNGCWNDSGGGRCLVPQALPLGNILRASGWSRLTPPHSTGIVLLPVKGSQQSRGRHEVIMMQQLGNSAAADLLDQEERFDFFTFALLQCSDGGQTWANQPWQVNGFPVWVPVLQGEESFPSVSPLHRDPRNPPNTGVLFLLCSEGCSSLPEMKSCG